MAGWSAAVLAAGLGVATAASTPLPPPIVTRDLDAAGRWARAHLPPACVDYLVDNAEQAYWLHLAVMGQPRSSARTADLDGYTSNRAIGRWLEGAPMAYAVAQRDLLPAELARCFQADMTRRWRKEHESHHVGAGLQRGIQSL